jgi:hypothetical protein
MMSTSAALAGGYILESEHLRDLEVDDLDIGGQGDTAPGKHSITGTITSDQILDPNFTLANPIPVIAGVPGCLIVLMVFAWNTVNDPGSQAIQDGNTMPLAYRIFSPSTFANAGSNTFIPQLTPYTGIGGPGPLDSTSVQIIQSNWTTFGPNTPAPLITALSAPSFTVVGAPIVLGPPPSPYTAPPGPPVSFKINYYIEYLLIKAS